MNALPDSFIIDAAMQTRESADSAILQSEASYDGFWIKDRKFHVLDRDLGLSTSAQEIFLGMLKNRKSMPPLALLHGVDSKAGRMAAFEINKKVRNVLHDIGLPPDFTLITEQEGVIVKGGALVLGRTHAIAKESLLLFIEKISEYYGKQRNEQANDIADPVPPASEYEAAAVSQADSESETAAIASAMLPAITSSDVSAESDIQEADVSNPENEGDAINDNVQKPEALQHARPGKFTRAFIDEIIANVEVKQKFISLWDAGTSNGEIARACGMSAPCVPVIAEELNLPCKQKQDIWSLNPDLVKRLKTLWDEGHSLGEIGRRLDVAKIAVVGKVGRLIEKNELMSRSQPTTAVVKPLASYNFTPLSSPPNLTSAAALIPGARFADPLPDPCTEWRSKVGDLVARLRTFNGFADTRFFARKLLARNAAQASSAQELETHTKNVEALARILNKIEVANTQIDIKHVTKTLDILRTCLSIGASDPKIISLIAEMNLHIKEAPIDRLPMFNDGQSLFFMRPVGKQYAMANLTL